MRTIFTILFLLLLQLLGDDAKELRVGIYDNPPKIFLDTHKRPSGFFPDILGDIAKKEGWRLKYVECEWTECLSMLERGDIDIMPDVAYSQERQKLFEFNAEAVLPNWSVVFANKKSKIFSITDLHAKKLVLLKNSIQHEQLQQIFDLFEVKPIYMYAKSYEEAFSLVQSSKADAAVTNRHFGERKINMRGVAKTAILLNPSVLKFAFSRSYDNEKTIERIDRHLKNLKDDKNSAYHTSYEKWLDIEERKLIPAWVYMALAGAFAALLLFAAAALFFKYLLGIKIKEANAHLQKNEQLQKQKAQDYKKTLLALISMVEQRDSYTAGHSQRVARYSSLIAKEMGYSEKEQELLYEASILHDIGKIATPDAVLLKPDKLTKLEYDLIKEHVNVAEAILKDIPMFEEILGIIKYHHEKYDGSGYPNGISGNDIPPLARVMSVADAFDAMTTNRIYKHKKSVKDALSEIESLSSLHYHPEAVQAAIRALTDIEISGEYAQTPTTAVEEHRFVYFYKDAVTDLYNVKYLEACLVNRANNAQKYGRMMIVSLHRFDTYNKKHGWENGNETLREFGELLYDMFESSLIFRIRANDFVVMYDKETDIKNIKEEIEKFTNTREIEFDINDIQDIESAGIDSYDALKRFL